MKKPTRPIYEICMFPDPDCPRPASVRGLCHTHYMCAAQLVSRKQTSWKELEKTGKVKPRKKNRGYPKGTSQKWFLGK